MSRFLDIPVHLRLERPIWVLMLVLFTIFKTELFADTNIAPIPPSQLKILAELVASLTFAPIAFSSASSEIGDSDKARLQQLAAKLVDLPFYIFVEAYTDQVGSADDNLELSNRRAEAARSVLLSSGKLSENQILSLGYGESEAKGITEAEQAKDRRLEMTLWQKKDLKISKNYLQKTLRARGVDFTLLKDPEPDINPRTRRKKLKSEKPGNKIFSKSQDRPASLFEIGLSPGISQFFEPETKVNSHRGFLLNLFPFELLSNSRLGVGLDYQLSETSIDDFSIDVSTLRFKIGWKIEVLAFKTSRLSFFPFFAYEQNSLKVEKSDEPNLLVIADQPAFGCSSNLVFMLAKDYLRPSIGVGLVYGPKAFSFSALLGVETNFGRGS